jgi:preprotein translocase subunit SecG
MYTVLVIVHVLVSVALVGLVLIQHGKGADAGAAFGSGASGTVFGSRGSANFLTRATAWLAAAFFFVSLSLAYLVHNRSTSGNVIDSIPAAPAAAAVETPKTPDAVVPPVETPNPSEKPSDAPKVPQ